MIKETKEQRFKRVAEKRVQNVINSIRSLSQLANNKIYKWNDDQLEKIWNTPEMNRWKKKYNIPVKPNETWGSKTVGWEAFIFYGSNHKSIKQPFIFIEGIDKNDEYGWKSYAFKIMHKHYLFNELLKNNFDIIFSDS